MSVVTAVRARASAVPAWAWLTGIVVVSIVVRIALAHRMVAPWIMSDELIYSELAKSLAATGHFSLRGVPSNGYGFVYPAVIAPAWRLFTAMPTVYTAAKVINSVVMSLTAVPAYFLARRVLRPALALAAAALSVAIPSMLFTGMLMTENVFYPLFVVVALALVMTLERPTPLRQILLLALCGLAYVTRAQAVALVPAVAIAPIVLGIVERRGVRGVLRPFATLYGIFAGGVVLVLLDTIARGRSIYSLLGAYRAATTSSYTASGILRYLLYHVAELDLAVGVIPFAALLALWLAPRSPAPAVRAFTVASLAIVPWLVLEVAAFASEQSGRIEERNMFYVTPLALIALLGLAENGAITRNRRPLVVAAAIAGVLPVFIPLARFVGPSATSDTFALLPWWWVQDQGIHFDTLRWVVLLVALAGGAIFLFLPRRLALVLPALVGAYFVATSFVVENGRHGIHHATLNSIFAGIDVRPDWIDHAVGSNAKVDYLWSGNNNLVYTVWENEFFNRSFDLVYNLGSSGSDVLPEIPVARRGNDVVADGRVVHATYVLADGTTELRGKVIAQDKRPGVRLYRIDGPLVLLTHVTGLYANDTWSGPTRNVSYQRLDCTGGKLAVSLSTDANLYTSDQTVTAYVNGKRAGEAKIPPDAPSTNLTVPLHPSPGTHTCLVRFETGPLLNPVHVHPKTSTDNRLLGAHFLSFTYTP
ncbi:MAG TPA: glycosyltransferase family 39 protein [Gaiellaceae bacterium]|nr:glycosyltransferase family 39 protein [Gaiellaceae bacterium]